MKIGVIVTTYNDGQLLIRCLDSIKRSLLNSDIDAYVICVDDGSEQQVSYPEFEVLRLPHRGRSYARIKGFEKVKKEACDYFLFLDSDMVLPEDFFEKIKTEIVSNPEIGGFVVSELAFSDYKNYWTLVKVFERNLYCVDCKIDSRNIEAARLWRVDLFPGFVEDLEAFEEIQPTIVAIKNGIKIKRIDSTFIFHDEKKVTFKNLLEKKSYYFSCMNVSDKCDLKEILKRFYFFRPQLYEYDNVKKYIKHPFLTLGVITLYVILTLVYIKDFLRVKFFRKVGMKNEKKEEKNTKPK